MISEQRIQIGWKSNNSGLYRPLLQKWPFPVQEKKYISIRNHIWCTYSPYIDVSIAFSWKFQLFRIHSIRLSPLGFIAHISAWSLSFRFAHLASMEISKSQIGIFSRDALCLSFSTKSFNIMHTFLKSNYESTSVICGILQSKWNKAFQLKIPWFTHESNLFYQMNCSLRSLEFPQFARLLNGE